MNVTHLECAACGLEHEAQRLHNLCRGCEKPLLVRYDLERAGRSLTKEALRGRRADMWRYREVLPINRKANLKESTLKGKAGAVHLPLQIAPYSPLRRLSNLQISSP